VRDDDAGQAVAEVAARVADALDLRILLIWVGHLQVAGLDLGADARGVDEGGAGEAVHSGDELVQGAGHDEVARREAACTGNNGRRIATRRQARP